MYSIAAFQAICIVKYRNLGTICFTALHIDSRSKLFLAIILKRKTIGANDMHGQVRCLMFMYTMFFLSTTILLCMFKKYQNVGKNVKILDFIHIIITDDSNVFCQM